MLNFTIPKFTTSDTYEKTSSKFPWFDILKEVSNIIHGVYYTMEDSSYAVYIKAYNTEAPEYRWWCPNCVLVVAGTKLSMGGVIFTLPRWPSVSQRWWLVSVWWEVLPRYWFMWCFHFSHYQGYACRQGPWYWLQTKERKFQSIIHTHWRQRYQKNWNSMQIGWIYHGLWGLLHSLYWRWTYQD